MSNKNKYKAFERGAGSPGNSGSTPILLDLVNEIFTEFCRNTREIDGTQMMLAMILWFCKVGSALKLQSLDNRRGRDN